jgi:hypothetical protein
MDWDEISNLYRGPSIDASYQASVHLARVSEAYICNSIQIYLNKNYLSFNRGEDFFRNQTIRNKNCLWQPFLLTNRDKISNFIEDLP